MDYTEDDLLAPWLGPDRLLLFVQIAEPRDDMAVRLRIDGRERPLKRAYNSIYPTARHAFRGFYADVADLKPDVDHELELTLPQLQPGQFQGVFFENVEDDTTDELAPTAPAGQE